MSPLMTYNKESSNFRGRLNKYGIAAINVAEAKKKLDKPLLRRKSELPTDVLTQKSLETYQVRI